MKVSFQKLGKVLHANRLKKRLLALLRQPAFWFITVFGNGLVILGSIGFHFAEKGVNPGLGSFLDSLAWSVGLVSTIGYGTLVPVTASGKVLGIFMMMGGCVFLWSYMALFVSALIAPDLGHLEDEVHELETDISEIKKDVNLDNKTAEKLIRSIDLLLTSIDKNSKKISSGS